MLARLSHFHGPLRAQAGRQGKIDRVDVLAGKQFLIAPDRPGGNGMGNAGGTAIDEVLRLGSVTAGHGHQFGIAGIVDRLPVLLGDSCGSKDAPTTFFLTHAYIQ